MDDVYAMELLRQSVIDACERENGLSLELQAAQKQMEELREHALRNRVRLQELDEALEIEEAKSNAERLARQQAEEKQRQHLVEVSKAKEMAIIAGKHCDAAEQEILRLQSDLSTERAATVAADRISYQLREDLEFARLNEMAAYNRVNAAEAKVYTLQEGLQLVTERADMLERRTREFEEAFEEEHQQLEEAKNALSTITHEFESTNLRLTETLEKYLDFEANHIKCDFGKDMAAILKTDSVNVDNHADAGSETKSPNSEQIFNFERQTEEETRVSGALKDGTVATNMPDIPEPAVLRPALASARACQVEIFQATGRAGPAPRTNPRNPLWRCLWRMPPKSLHLFFRISGRR